MRHAGTIYRILQVRLIEEYLLRYRDTRLVAEALWFEHGEYEDFVVVQRIWHDYLNIPHAHTLPMEAIQARLRDLRAFTRIVYETYHSAWETPYGARKQGAQTNGGANFFEVQTPTFATITHATSAVLRTLYQDGVLWEVLYDFRDYPHATFYSLWKKCFIHDDALTPEQEALIYALWRHRPWEI